MSENPVLFGVKDAKLSDPSLYDNVLFGSAKWLCKPTEEQQKCRITGEKMALVAQSE